MTKFKSAALFSALVILLVSPTGSLRAAPDKTLGMALLSAAVHGDGTLAHGAGVVSTSRPNPGTYLVTFDRDLQNCTCAAMHAGTSGIFGDINVVAFCPGSSGSSVELFTSNGSGFTNVPFHLIVFCAK